jgi:hypothetical protein
MAKCKFDRALFDRALNAYRISQSLDEFTIQLDLMNMSIQEFTSMYLENIVSVCPKFFKILRRLKDNEQFDVIEFTNLANWIIKAPIKVKCTNSTLTIRRPDGNNVRNYKAQIYNALSVFDLDPMYEVCSVAVHKLYEAYYGKI